MRNRLSKREDRTPCEFSKRGDIEKYEKTIKSPTKKQTKRVCKSNLIDSIVRKKQTNKQTNKRANGFVFVRFQNTYTTLFAEATF